MNRIQETINKILPLDADSIDRARNRLDSLTKPPGSLGRLEKLAKQLAGIYKMEIPVVKKKGIVIMAGDHGIVAEGVSAFPQEVTPQMLLNFVHGGAAINVLGRHVGADIVLVDVGMAVAVEHPKVKQLNVRRSTANMAEGPAMSREEAERAICVGLDLAQEMADNGYNLLATGEMGIGNTTPSTALMAAFTGYSLEAIAGRGTGLDDAGLQRKVAAIEKALRVNKPNPQDPLDVLAKVGGLEIGALAGLILGAAAAGIPVVVDGFISGAAALLAIRLKAGVVDYLIPSHQSAEPGHSLLLQYLGLDSIFKMDMRLGEGTGAALGMNVVEAACKITAEMATFAEAGVSKG